MVCPLHAQVTDETRSSTLSHSNYTQCLLDLFRIRQVIDVGTVLHLCLENSIDRHLRKPKRNMMKRRKTVPPPSVNSNSVFWPRKAFSTTLVSAAPLPSRTN